MKWHSGDIDSECIYASGMSEYVDNLFAYLNEEVVFLLEKISLGDIDGKLEEIRDRRLEQGDL